MNRTNLTRRRLLEAVGIGAAAAAAPRAGAAATATGQRKPNIVLILVDDMGWTDARCCGSTYYDTPHIDRLAERGMRFTDGYAACAVCSPTRAAVMTGRYPARLGVTDWIRARFQGGKIPPDGKNPSISGWTQARGGRLSCPLNALWMELDEITIAEALKPAGYTSCHIGKWHLGPDAWYPDKQGFDYNIGGCDFGQPPSYFDPYERGRQGGIPTLKPRKAGEYLTDREADEAVAFIRKHRDKPFFLYMAHYAVHTPLMGKKDVVAKYKARKPTHQKNPVYAAMVESVDDAVGKIVGALEDLKIAGETLVIFTSDNGGLLGPTSNLPLRSGKGYPYEGGIREPLIVRWDGVVKPRSTCNVPVTSVDYFPTVCQAAGAALPAGRDIDGESIIPLLKQTGTLKRDAIFWHFPHYRGQVVPYSIIRQGKWKLIRRYTGKPFELFDLEADLAEKTDLADTMPDKVKHLDARLTAWLTHVNAKIPRKADLETPT